MAEKDLEPDYEREERLGFPEVIFAPGKDNTQLREASEALYACHKTILVTRVTEKQAQVIQDAIPEAVYNEKGHLVYVVPEESRASRSGGRTLVITAGTSDVPVGEEAACTAEVTGQEVERLYDVGVAGLHRILNAREKLEAADVIIVVAGMEGALPSVVGGLIDRPVIAVPTSVGYGTAFNGVTPLLGMLNSCAPGVTVVNVDNGFGAAFAANRILRSLNR